MSRSIRNGRSSRRSTQRQRIEALGKQRKHWEKEQRKRRRELSPHAREFIRMRAALIFLLSLAAGVALAIPIEKQLGRWAQDGLGTLQKISIQGNSQLSFDEVALATGIQPGRALADVDPLLVESRLRREPWIRDASVLTLPPSTLLVRVEERKPRALLLDSEIPPTIRAARLVDSSGFLFASALGDEDLPRLVGGENLALNHEHESLNMALGLLENLEELDLEALGGSRGPIELWLPRAGSSEGWVLRGNLEIILGHDHLMGRLRRLSDLLDSGKIRALRGEERFQIDLRFADQAVLRNLPEEERSRESISQRS
jgi:hypothetical protein